MTYLICWKTMRRCETQSMCAPFQGCESIDSTNERGTLGDTQINTMAALNRVAGKLVKAGAKIPLENNGSIESAMNGGLSIALLLVNEEIDAAIDASTPRMQPNIPQPTPERRYCASLEKDRP